MSGGGNGYEIKVEALTKAANAYTDGAAKAANAAAWIDKNGYLPTSAFGHLSGSEQLAAGYQRLLSQVGDDLNKLSAGLKTGGGKLGSTAKRYTAVEKAAMRDLKSRG